MIQRRITKDEVLDAPVSAYTEGNTRMIPIVEEVVADRENQNPDERK